MNLKDETLFVLAMNGKTKEDVRWVGTTEYKIPTEQFWKLADNYYDSGYGAAEVATDLIVVGDCWLMRRWEYDGSEGWEFLRYLNEPKETRSVDRLMRGMWNTLDALNRESEEVEDE